MSPKSIGQALWGTVTTMVKQVFVDPVREGSIRVAWPAGLRPIAAVGIVGYIVAVGLAISAEWIRASVPLADQLGSALPPQPRAVLWVTFALAALAISLGQAGSIHSRSWVRWAVTTMTVLVLLLVATPDFSWFARGYSIVASIGLVVLVAVRGTRNRSFQWWEFAVIVGIVFSTFAISVGVVSARSLPLGYDFTPTVVSLVLVSVGQLALPAAMAAGAAVAELAVSLAVGLVTSVRDRLGLVALYVVLAIVVVWRVWDLWPYVASVIAEPSDELRGMLSAAVYLVAIAGSWVVLRRLRRGTSRLTAATLIAALASTSLLIAAFLTPTVPGAVINLGGLVALSYGGPSWIEGFVGVGNLVATSSVAINATRALTGVGLIVIALVLARRGRRVLPELLVAVGLTQAAFGLGGLVGTTLLWTPDALSLVATLAAVVLGAWMLVVRTATVNRVAAVTGALLVAALFAHRDFLADPLATIGIAVGSAALLVGLTWAFLTGFAVAREHSLRYPLASRVMLVLANAVFAVTVLAYGALSRDPDSTINLQLFNDLGTTSFGDALIACALVTAFIAALRDRELA
ncbi:hypothetical protein ACWKWO_10395 [Schumannella luteola]